MMPQKIYGDAPALNFSGKKLITLEEDDLEFKLFTSAESVEDFFSEQGVNIKPEDKIFPDVKSKIYPAMTIAIQHAQKISIILNKNAKTVLSFEKDFESAVKVAGIELTEDDLFGLKGLKNLSSSATRKVRPFSGAEVTVTKVTYREEIVNEPIKFSTETEEDAEMSWRKKVIEQKGINGVREIKYQIVSHDGKEISRKVIEKNITKEPTAEIAVQGTKIVYGKTNNGMGTWYSYGGQLTAASPWLPMGSYCEVENTANGKRVIVRINDRGPFGTNRIIDLEKTAFAKISDLGAGVIDVKVREIKN